MNYSSVEEAWGTPFANQVKNKNQDQIYDQNFFYDNSMYPSSINKLMNPNNSQNLVDQYRLLLQELCKDPDFCKVLREKYLELYSNKSNIKKDCSYVSDSEGEYFTDYDTETETDNETNKNTQKNKTPSSSKKNEILQLLKSKKNGNSSSKIHILDILFVILCGGILIFLLDILSRSRK